MDEPWPGKGFMSVLLRDGLSMEFYAGKGRWTLEPMAAFAFRDTGEAAAFADECGRGSLEMVLSSCRENEQRIVPVGRAGANLRS